MCAAMNHTLVAQFCRVKSKHSCLSLQMRIGELFSISSWKSFRRVTEATKASMCRYATVLPWYRKHAECQVVSEAFEYCQMCLRKQTCPHTNIFCWHGMVGSHVVCSMVQASPIRTITFLVLQPDIDYILAGRKPISA